MRLFRLFAILGATLVLAVVVMAFAEFSSPELGRALLERAGAATGMRLEADEFRLSLLRGLSLRAVRAKGTYAGGRYELTLDRIVFQHRLLPLLFGRLAVDRIRFDKPHAVLIETGGGAPSGAGSAAMGAAAATSIALHVDRIAIVNGTIEVRGRGSAPITVSGLHVSLRDLALAPGGGSALGRLSGRGDFQADEIVSPVTLARDAAGTLRLAAGRLDADELRFRTDEGRFRTRWSADLARLPFSYTLAVEGRPLDVNAVLGAKGKGGFGAGHLTFDGRGVGPEPAGLSGMGVLSLEAGTLPTTPLLTAVERALGRTRLSGVPYKASTMPFRIDRGRIIVDRARLDSDAVSLEASGWSRLDGPLELDVAVRTPRQTIAMASVPPAALDALADGEGWVRIPLRVTGTRDAPRVSPDVPALLADARREGGKVLANRAAEKLKGLLQQ